MLDPMETPALVGQNCTQQLEAGSKAPEYCVMVIVDVTVKGLAAAAAGGRLMMSVRTTEGFGMVKMKPTSGRATVRVPVVIVML